MKWLKSAFCEFTKKTPFRLIEPPKSNMMPQAISGRNLIAEQEIVGKGVADKDLAKIVQGVLIIPWLQVRILLGPISLFAASSRTGSHTSAIRKELRSPL